MAVGAKLVYVWTFPGVGWPNPVFGSGPVSGNGQPQPPGHAKVRHWLRPDDDCNTLFFIKSGKPTSADSVT